MEGPLAAERPSPIATSASRARFLLLAQWSAFLAAWAIVVPVEISRWQDQPPAFRNVFGWFVDWNIDSSPYAIWLLIAPLCWLWPRSRAPQRLRNMKSPTVGELPTPATAETAANLSLPRGPRWRAFGICLIVGLASLANSAWIGSHFGGLPPAYHDEYSYLIQAQTFAAGRVTYPSPPASELFDQIHVLNLGKFASRYFPGTGAWLAPFFSFGHPVWGQWLASAIAAILFCLAGRELAGDFVGLLTGLLISLSPGISIFSNLLLAHQPTLLGLGLFLFAWLRTMKSKSMAWSVTCGLGLTFAMLCRPLTAAAFALPFGLWMLIRGIAAGCESAPEFRRWIAIWCGVGIPLMVGGAGLFVYNQAVTGDGWLTPYSQYTAVYTPRHVYGFNNVEKGNQRQGSRVMESYDLWAENLTPELAARNAIHRVLASGQWTLGLVPLAMSLIVGLFLCRRWEVWLLLAAIVSLHIAHIPYWFVGIMGWHYVFESAPLWCLWFAIVSLEMLQDWQAQRRRVMVGWWCGLLVIAGLTSYTSVAGLWNQSRVGAAIRQIEYPRRRYAEFINQLKSLSPVPTLVLIEGDSADRSFDLVVNEPEFRNRILRGRYLPLRIPIPEVRRQFPDRRVLRYRVRDQRFGPAD